MAFTVQPPLGLIMETCSGSVCHKRASVGIRLQNNANSETALRLNQDESLAGPLSCLSNQRVPVQSVLLGGVATPARLSSQTILSLIIVLLLSLSARYRHRCCQKAGHVDRRWRCTFCCCSAALRATLVCTRRCCRCCCCWALATCLLLPRLLLLLLLLLLRVQLCS